MATYIMKDAYGHITESADTDAWVCSEEERQWTIVSMLERGYVLSPRPVVRGYDGLYFEGQVPVRPTAEITVEFAASVRAERDRRLREVYDPMVLQLTRRRRNIEAQTPPGDTGAVNGKIAEWDAYATALEQIPERPGFPWAGGGVADTACPWPIAPEAM